MKTQEQTLIPTLRTTKFVRALRKLAEAENEVISAMTETYGDEQGNEMTSKLPFNEIRDELLRCMGVVIVENQFEDPSLM